MSLAVEVWRSVERWNPLQKRAADGTWGDGAGRFRGDGGVVILDRTEDGGLDIGVGNPAFTGEAPDVDDDSGDVHGGSARLSPAAAQKLHADLSAVVAEGSRRQKAVDAYYNEHGELPDGYEWETTGYVSGEGADVHYKLDLYDPSVGVEMYVAAIPHSSDDTIDDAYDADVTARFDAAETRKLLARLATAGGATESVALDLWRALEARHNLRGPNGRFIKAGGGGGSDRPSLADAVRGTAAGGPKRQRDNKGGMSIADAVRSAARNSDSTGRPTQRTPAEHRAEGAHDVADEVERALADQGVPEAQRKEIAARTRAAADAHGKRAPSTKLEDQATYDLEGWLHHFGTEHRRSGAVMRELDRRRVRDGKPAAPASPPAPPPAPEVNLPHPKAPAKAPAPKPSAPKPASKPRRGSRLDGGQLAEVEGQLNSATSMDQAREHLAGLNGPQLRQIADFARVYVTSADPKEILIGRILNATTRRRLEA